MASGRHPCSPPEAASYRLSYPSLIPINYNKNFFSIQETRKGARAMSRKVIISIIVLFFFMVLSASAVLACTLGGVTGKMAEKHHILFGQTCDNA